MPADPSPHPSDILRQEPEISFRLLVEQVLDYAIFLLDPHGRIMTWNGGAERALGYQGEEIIGQHFSRVYTPEELAAGKPKRDLQIAETDGRVENEGWRVRKGGSLFWANDVITTLHDPEGRRRGFAMITRDTTERKRNEENLRQSEEGVRLLIESVKDYAIIQLDPDGRVASWNAGAERTMGYPAAEIIGRPFSTFYTPEDVAAGKTVAELRAAMADGRVEDEGWRVRKDGSRFWADTIITAQYNPAGALRGFAKVTRDVNERKRAQEELRQAHADLERRVAARTAELTAANEELREADRRKTDFLAMLAHELRNPLAPVRNALQILRLTNTDPAMAEWARAMIDRQVRHLALLIDDLLDVSRLTRGLVQLRRGRIDLAQLVRTAAEDRRRVIEDAGLSFGLEAPTDPIWVDGDPTRVTQIVGNLLDNAVKFTDRGGRVDLRVEANRGHATLTVRDTGVGIAAEMLPRLFTVFGQADRSLDRAAGGLGLGLVLVKGLAELHGGTVTAASAGPGHGATFAVHLPLASA